MYVFTVLISSIILIFLYLNCLPKLSLFWGNRDAPMWYHVSESIPFSNDQNPKIVMLGDSRAKAGWIPDKYQYNFSLGGSTPIEGYIQLKRILRNRTNLPEILILSYAPYHLMYVDSYWGRTVSYYFFTPFEHYSLFYEVGKLEPRDVPDALQEDLYWENVLPGSKVDELHRLFSASIPMSTYKSNVDALNVLYKANGHSFFGTNNGDSRGFKEVKYTSFQPNRLLESKLREIIDLADRNSIRIFWADTPFNQSTCDNISPAFIEQYLKYIESLSVDILKKLECYPDILFGDPSHLYLGSRRYTKELSDQIDIVLAADKNRLK